MAVAEGRAVAAAGSTAARYKPERVNNRPSDVIAPRDTSVAFKWLLSRLCLDADVDLWNSIKFHGLPYRSSRLAVFAFYPSPLAPRPDCLTTATLSYIPTLPALPF